MTHIFILLALCMSVSGRLHEPSRVQYDGVTDSNFGFSLSYQRSKQQLIVGKPRIDLNGAVDACPVWSNDKKLCATLLNSEIMKDSWTNFSREHSPNQHFMLGATVAAASNYVLACAPLFSTIWTYTKIYDGKVSESKKFQAVGRCFIQNGSAGPSALVNAHENNGFATSLGWSALVDEEADALLLPRLTGVMGTVTYTPASNPRLLEKANLALGSEGLIKDNRYIGQAITSGKFFKNEGTVYATAWEDTARVGYVGFLGFGKRSLGLKIILNSQRKKVFIKCKRGQNMFGASLHMADFNQDAYFDLIVGAPAEPYEDEYEAGAIYVYKGGFPKSTFSNVNKVPLICVRHDTVGARFGTALASLDLDEDDRPELFISAPYEARGGVVYVMSGKHVADLLERRSAECTSVQEYYQVLTTEYKSFGYVLHFAQNFDNNGGNVLAVGAPLIDKVFAYRSIPAYKIDISLKLKDQEIVRELDSNFTVTVVIQITYPAKQKKATGYLSVETSITTDLNQTVERSAKPDIQDPNYIIDLSGRQALVSKDVVVKLNDYLPHTYDFLAIVKSDESLLTKKEYSEDLLCLSDDTQTKKSLQILRRCKGDECVPRLSMALQWSGSSHEYVLGSSLYAKVTVFIKNEGKSSYESCAKVNVIGAKIADWTCDERKLSNVCRFQELTGSAKRDLVIKLDMSKVSHRSKELSVAVSLYSKCSDEKPTKADEMTIKYKLNTAIISVKGSYFPLNITDRDIEINKNTSSTVGLLQTFTITNNGSVVWKGLETDITILKQPYIQGFVILDQDNVYCTKQNDTVFIKYKCVLDLDPESYIEIKTEVNIAKNAVVNNINDKNLIFFNTEIVLKLLPTEHKNFTLEASAMYVKDTSFRNDKTIIIIAAICLSLLVLLITALILYKCGFFKRNAKIELDELKKSNRRRLSTVIRPESTFHHMDYDGELQIEEIGEEHEVEDTPDHSSQDTAQIMKIN